MFKRLNPHHYSFKRIIVKTSLISLLSFLIISANTQFGVAQAVDQTITISDNFTMIEAGEIEVKANDIIVEEDYAFIIEQKSVLVYNIGDKSTPILISNYTNEMMNLSSIKKSESYLIVCGNNLFIFKFMNNELLPISETELSIGPYNNTMEKCTLDISMDVALITTRQGFVLVNISDVSSPTFISEVYLGDAFHRYVAGGSFYDDYVLISNFEMYGSLSRILIYNISNILEPEYLTSFQGTLYSQRGEFVYTINQDYLMRYDITNIAAPWADSFAGGLSWENFDLDLYHKFVIILVRDHQWTISFYNIDCYPFQKILDIEVDKQYNRLYIGNDFGYFLSDNGIDIFQLNYHIETSLFSFYPSFLLGFVILLITSLSNKLYKRILTKRATEETAMEKE
ncbi:MAG: hypothetical protein ACTSSH_02205 [Candidatus Heimdallarchaeota archaeon]